jgi:mannose-1-phosphate guanylyltransferase/phosphomannomutase
MKVVILAGGEGTRLRPLTLTTPKSMLPVGSKPAIDHLVRHVAASGFNDLIITVNYLKEQIMHYLSDGSKFGVKICYMVEPDNNYLGTAGSTKLAKEQLTETFVIFQGDAYTEIDICKALEFHKKNGSDATIVLKSVSNPWSYGVAILDKDSRIVDFQERPPKERCKSNLTSTGIYILEPHVLDFVGDGMFDFAKDVFPRLLAANKRMFGWISNEFWVDIGSREAYLLANMREMDKMRGRPSQDHSMYGTSCIIPPVLVEDCVTVGKHCSIGPYTILKKSVKVNDYSVIERSLVFEDVCIGSYCNVISSIIDKSATLEDSVTITDALVGRKALLKEFSEVPPGNLIWPESSWNHS